MNLFNALHTTWYPVTNYISTEVCSNDSWNFPSLSPPCFSSRQKPSRVKKDEHMAKPITDILVAFKFCPWACLNVICGAPSLFPSKDSWDGTCTQAKAKRDPVEKRDTNWGCRCQGPRNTLWKHHASEEDKYAAERQWCKSYGKPQFWDPLPQLPQEKKTLIHVVK